MQRNCIAVLYIVLIVCLLATGTLSPSDKSKGKKQKDLKLRKGPVDKNVFDRGLIDEEPSPTDILVEHAAYYKNRSQRLFDGPTLGYVTPWNNHGYDVAKMWAEKFDIISPVWLQILREGENKYELAGRHDIDKGWLEDVRKASHNKIEILPRIIFDKFTEQDYSKLLSYDSEQSVVNQLIIDACKKYKFDGIVLEFWPQLALRVDDVVLYKLVIGMATTLRIKKLKLILVVPPLRDEKHDLFSSLHFQTLHPYVYAFSLMTYDYSNVERPGANAPLKWMQKSIEHIVPTTIADYRKKRKQLLLGLNMYGNDYTPDGGGPIIGGQFVDYVKELKQRLTLDEHDSENFFEIKTSTGRHYIFYPTLYSINERLKLAREMGCGVSLWELGQGLDYFYDLF